MSNDPLTSIRAMIAMIEPGVRMIDCTILKDLLVQAGEPAAAASIDPAPRLVDTQFLWKIAADIGAVRTENYMRSTQEVKQRLIDGTVWKNLSMMASGEIAPFGGGPLGETDKQGPSESQFQPIRTSGEGDWQERERSRIIPDPGQEPREERSGEGFPTWDLSREESSEGSGQEEVPRGRAEGE